MTQLDVDDACLDVAVDDDVALNHSYQVLGKVDTVDRVVDMDHNVHFVVQNGGCSSYGYRADYMVVFGFLLYLVQGYIRITIASKSWLRRTSCHYIMMMPSASLANLLRRAKFQCQALLSLYSLKLGNRAKWGVSATIAMSVFLVISSSPDV